MKWLGISSLVAGSERIVQYDGYLMTLLLPVVPSDMITFSLNE